MIYSVAGTRIKKLPHAKEWATWSKRLTPGQYNTVRNEINSYIDRLLASPERIKRLKAAWITGSNWQGGPFQRLYEVMGMSETLSGYFAGLFVWVVLEERSERFMVSQEEDIIGKIYDYWPEE